MVYSFIDIVSVFQKYKEENDRNRFYYKIYEAFSEPLIHEKKNIEELNFVDVICKYENIIKNYKENLKDVKIEELLDDYKVDEEIKTIKNESSKKNSINKTDDETTTSE